MKFEVDRVEGFAGNAETRRRDRIEILGSLDMEFGWNVGEAGKIRRMQNLFVGGQMFGFHGDWKYGGTEVDWLEILLSVFVGSRKLEAIQITPHSF